MTHNPSISIIVSASHAQAWLQRAICSLQNQTFKSYEILLVDSEETASTGMLCDRLADEDMRIRVIRIKNASSNKARNAAMKIARGTYLYFMDHNNWCDKNMLSNMFDTASKNNLDLLIASFSIDTYYDNEFRYYRETHNAPDKVYRSRNEFRNEAYKLLEEQLLDSPWNKLYRRKYLSDHDFHFSAESEDDLAFNLNVIKDIEHIGCISGNYFHLLQMHNESKSAEYCVNMYRNREKEYSWIKSLFEYWNIETPEVIEFQARRYAERLVGCIENVTNQNCTLSAAEKKKAIRKMISTPHAREALKIAKPRTKIMGMVLRPLRMGNVNLTMMQSLLISWVRQNSTNLFVRLKSHK